MTREEARKNAQIMLAYANGKNIESKFIVEGYSRDSEEFKTINSPDFDFRQFAYRIKGEKPQYRPFNTQELQKLFLLDRFIVQNKRMGTLCLVTTVQGDYISFDGEHVSNKELLEDYTFANGSVCGVCVN